MMNRIQMVYLFLALLLAGSSAGGSSGLPLEGKEAETFLMTSEIVHRETLQIGVTRSQRDLILQRAERLVAGGDPAAVLYP